MLIIDYSGIAFPSILRFLNQHKRNEITYEEGRALILHSIRNLIRFFNGEFGVPVICIDSHVNLWRVQEFPEYKAKRKETKQSSTTVNWQSIYEATNGTKEEMEKFFPVFVTEKQGFEGDDLIAAFTLAKKEDTVICSEDKDFYQLLFKKGLGIFHNRRKEIYYNTLSSEYSILNSRYIRKVAVDDSFAIDYLVEHIIKGDTIDGVPNILSPDDCFLTGTRQVIMTKKRLEHYKAILLGKEDKNTLTDDERRGIARNKLLISLVNMDKKCEDVLNNVLPRLETIYKDKNVMNLQQYFISNNLDEFAVDVHSFYPRIKK